LGKLWLGDPSNCHDGVTDQRRKTMQDRATFCLRVDVISVSELD
jgi:hypothetical protein